MSVGGVSAMCRVLSHEDRHVKRAIIEALGNFLRHGARIAAGDEEHDDNEGEEGTNPVAIQIEDAEGAEALLGNVIMSLQ